MSATSSANETRPPVRRIVTGHTAEGKAIVAEDSLVAPRPFMGAEALFTDIHASEGFPSSNDGEFRDTIKEKFSEQLVNPNGSIIRVVDTPPGGSSVSRNAFLAGYLRQ